jgi:hypothetical protein
MIARSNDLGGLTTVRTVGGLIPADLLGRVLAGQDLDGLTADDFHLELGVTPKEAANRAWSVLTGAWTAYRDALASRPEGDRATSLTREKWLAVLLRELGFGRVPTTPAGGLRVDDRAFPVSHHTGALPIHLLGWGVDLDCKSAGVPGAADRAPHAMVQELLNRSDQYLWGIVANGGTLRLLRDSSNLVGQAYVEFDLEAMFDSEAFSDFVALFLLGHQTRFEPLDPGGRLEACWLERWRADAIETGARALGQLRDGVKEAIQTLGTGFLQHPTNADLRARLEPGGGLDLADYHRALLRLVYRLLFCFVAEDRGFLLDPDASDAARSRYATWFSTARLRRIAMRRRGTRHADLWQALSLVIEGLGSDDGRPELAIPGIGGLFEDGPVDVVTGQELGNGALLAAIRCLCVIQPKKGGPRRNVDYRNLGAEELGGIYESLLEFVPRYDPVLRSFTLETLAGNERKTSGAYYTPTSLIDCLLDSALDPLLDGAERAADPEAGLLDLKVCDPACGSGHFLVAAARRIAHRLARVRAEDTEPTASQVQEAMHDVVARCIFGVDLNPMAAELAKVGLWLESLRAGRPLGFLDAHIKTGNALLGTTPALLAAGIPDEAFTVLEGDDRQVVTALKRQNRSERNAGQAQLFTGRGIPVGNPEIAQAAREIDALAGLSLADVHLAGQRQRDLEGSPELQRVRLVADAWCAAFVGPKVLGEPAITQAILQAWAGGTLPSSDDPHRRSVERLRAQYRLFHWHLEFPQVFTADPDADGPGWLGGFDCVLGNPPWERVKLQEQEFFAAHAPKIATAPNAAARKRLIRALEEVDPALFAEFGASKRRAEGESHLLRHSGRYPLCGRGDINTYAVFAEHDRTILGPTGRLGVILPTGIATDVTTQHYFKDLIATRTLVSLYDFENRQPFFESVDSRFKFCLLTLSGRRSPVEAADFAFFTHDPAALARDGVRFPLTPGEIQLLNPNTGTCPVFRSRRDAELTLAIYRRVPIAIRHGEPDGNPWGLSFTTMFHMSNDSDLFHTAEGSVAEGWTLDGNRYRRGSDEMLPLYEGKMGHAFDHRFASFHGPGDTDLEELGSRDPEVLALPRYWVASVTCEERADRRDWGGRSALLGHRRIARNNDERTCIAALLPWVPASNGWILSSGPTTPALCLLAAVLNSFVYDFCLRNSLSQPSIPQGTSEQVPVPTPAQLDEPVGWAGGSAADFMLPRVLELTYTAWDMEPLARDLGDDGPPFRWDQDRRAVLRAELDALCFHLYGIDDRDDADHILGTFPIVNRKDIDRYGEERTRRLVLGSYDRMAEAARTRTPFTSELDPPPGHGSRHPAPGWSIDVVR